MRNWAIRPQVAMVLLVPLLALTGIGSWVAAGELGQARASKQTRTAAQWLVGVNALVHALQIERYAVSSLVGSGYRVTSFEVQAASAATDVDSAYRRVAASAQDLPEGSRNRVADAVSAARKPMDQLAGLRASVANHSLQPGPGTIVYTEMIHGWLDAGAALTGIGNEDPDLVRIASALSAISWTGEQVDQQYGYLSAAINLGNMLPDSAIRVQAAIGGEEAWTRQFRSTALPDQIGFFDHTVEASATKVAAMRDEVLSGRAKSVRFEDWDAISEQKQTALRTVETRIVGDLEARSTRLAREADERALVSALTVLAILLVSIAVSVFIAARLVRALRELRNGALRVAQQRLPEVTARLRDGTVVDPAAEPPVFASPPRNEIGDVADACNTLYGAAIRATYEMATVRSTGDVMRTLARRSLSLTRRQLRLITDLERAEEDPKTMEMLFGIDHQATRMRRLAESLLVLAGEQPHRRQRDAAPLREVLRAAAAEVEDYTRVKIAPDGDDVRIVADVVGDLTHLLAELLENATAFSPVGSPVEVRSGQVGQGWAIDIEDRGVGLDPATLEQINARLADPPPFEPRAGGQIGLVVVARLAARHNIVVQMRRGMYFGVHVVVILPARVLHGFEPALDAAVAGTTETRTRDGEHANVARHRRNGRASATARVNGDAPRPVPVVAAPIPPAVDATVSLPRIEAPDEPALRLFPPAVDRTAGRPRIEAPDGPVLPLLPQRVRGSHLADPLRDLPDTPSTAAAQAASASPDDARRLAAGFMNGYARGQRASTPENGR